MNSIAVAAHAAEQAEISVIPIRMDGSKAPMVPWKQYQSDRVDPLMLDVWFDQTQAMAAVCGQVSQNLVCIDFEGAFWTNAKRMKKMAEALDAAGLMDLFIAWSEGYSELTPGHGAHVFIRVMGDGCPPNTKLAMGPDGECWVETRGEGGYVIVAPSHGSAHPSGRGWVTNNGSWDTICWVTPEDWAHVAAVITEACDESPPPPPPLQLTPSTHNGDGWIGQALATYPSVGDVLKAHGWDHISTDNQGQLWRHPRAHSRHSARINNSGRFLPFSTSLPFPIDQRRTYDAVDVDFALTNGCLPTQAERVEALRPFKPQVVRSVAIEPDRTNGDEPTHIPTNIGLNRPMEFWEARAPFRHIYQAARSWDLSPDTVFEAFRTNYAALIPPNITLPEYGTLDWISVVVGASGFGKTRSQTLAMKLLEELPWREDEALVLGFSPGSSGEGFIEAYLEPRKEKGLIRKRIKHRGIAFYADEGHFINQISQRSGNTTLSTIKSAFSGMMIGTSAATGDRTRRLLPREVRFSLLIAITPNDAARFLASDNTDGGWPQRLSWAWAHDDYDGPLPEYPGPLDLPYHDYNMRTLGAEMTYSDDVTKIWHQERRMQRLGTTPTGLDGHRTLSCLKAASMFALMDDRFHVTLEDWDLAVMDNSTSRTVRQHVSDQGRSHAEAHHRTAGRNMAIRDDAADEYRMAKCIDVVIRALKRREGPVLMKQMKDLLKHKPFSPSVIIDAAIAAGKVVHEPGQGLKLT